MTRDRCPDCGNGRDDPWKVVNPRWPSGGGPHRERCLHEFHDKVPDGATSAPHDAGNAGRTED